MTISSLFYDPVLDLAELDRRMGRAAALGYGGVELVATFPPPYPAEAVASLIGHHGSPVISLLSGWSYANEGLCLSRPSVADRDRAVARLVDYVRLAARWKTPVLVVELMQGLRSDEPDEARANDRIADGLRRVARAAEGEGVSVVIEPVNHQQVGFNNTLAEAAAMAERVGSPALGYMLDTFHMNVEERDVVGAVREHGPRARHVHLCETNGGPFGTGHLDFAGVLAALGSAGYDRAVSVKIYRKAGWDEAARSAADFLRGCGVRMG
jgi:sugar phosphate isomerase/epimerase